MLEGWKYDVRNLWWIIDYNRQSLDGVVSDGLFRKIQEFFRTVDWQVVTLKYGKKLQRVFAQPGGDALEKWIDDCPNDLYSALTFKGQSAEPGAWRERARFDLKGVSGIRAILAQHDNKALHRLMTHPAAQAIGAVPGVLPAHPDTTPRH